MGGALVPISHTQPEIFNLPTPQSNPITPAKMQLEMMRLTTDVVTHVIKWGEDRQAKAFEEAKRNAAESGFLDPDPVSFKPQKSLNGRMSQVATAAVALMTCVATMCAIAARSMYIPE